MLDNVRCWTGGLLYEVFRNRLRFASSYRMKNRARVEARRVGSQASSAGEDGSNRRCFRQPLYRRKTIRTSLPSWRVIVCLSKVIPIVILGRGVNAIPASSFHDLATIKTQAFRRNNIRYQFRLVVFLRS